VPALNASASGGSCSRKGSRSHSLVGSPFDATLLTATGWRHRKRKKADGVEYPEVFDPVGLLVNEPPGQAGLPFV